MRDTAGIIATVISVQPVEHGYAVGCRIENKRRQSAEQIVLCVTLLDSKDQMIAANPLISTPHLAAGQTLELLIFIPADTNISPPKNRVQVSLVRWTGE